MTHHGAADVEPVNSIVEDLLDLVGDELFARGKRQHADGGAHSGDARLRRLHKPRAFDRATFGVDQAELARVLVANKDRESRD